MVVIDTNSNAVQEDLIIASHPTIDKCSGVQINLYLKLTKKKTIPNLHFPSIHPSDLPQKLYLQLTLSIHLSILPSIHTSDLPQELSQTYTNQSIHPAYLKLTLIHPFIHLTYHKNFLKLTLIHPSILSIAYTNPSIYPSLLYLRLTLSILPSFHPSIHLTYHKNCISVLHYLSTHLAILPSKLTLINPSIQPISNLH